MSTNPRRLAIVEDESELRRTIADILSDDDTWVVTGSYPNAELAVPALIADPPDVILMDIQLPAMSGIECAAVMKAAQPEVQILMLTVYDNSERVFSALAAGASGYLLKRDVPTRLLESISEVLAGGSPISSSIARKVFQHFMKEVPTLPGEDFKLSPREKQILDLLAKGQLYKEIASHLEIGTETVRFHLRNIYKKLHVRTRTEAVVKYLGR